MLCVFDLFFFVSQPSRVLTCEDAVGWVELFFVIVCVFDYLRSAVSGFYLCGCGLGWWVGIFFRVFYYFFTLFFFFMVFCLLVLRCYVLLRVKIMEEGEGEGPVWCGVVLVWCGDYCMHA